MYMHRSTSTSTQCTCILASVPGPRFLPTHNYKYAMGKAWDRGCVHVHTLYMYVEYMYMYMYIYMYIYFICVPIVVDYCLQIFYPITTDLYDRKNMPRVIYCIHALRLAKQNVCVYCICTCIYLYIYIYMCVCVHVCACGTCVLFEV